MKNELIILSVSILIITISFLFIRKNFFIKFILLNLFYSLFFYFSGYLTIAFIFLIVNTFFISFFLYDVENLKKEQDKWRE